MQYQTDLDGLVAKRDEAIGRSLCHAITIGQLKHALNLAVLMLGELEECLDAQIYPEQVKDDFDAPDDRLYELTMTAGQWRMLAKSRQQAIEALVKV